MRTCFYIPFFFFPFYSCTEKNADKESYNVRADVRFGTKFYSIFLNEQGKAYAIKGVGSDYTDTFNVKSSDTSRVFKLDSTKIFLMNLDKIKSHPIIEGVSQPDAPRVEIYFDQQKIYDVYKWDGTFWGLFRPIMEQIPKGYNPFRISENPF
jgi:hypothetical protein